MDSKLQIAIEALDAIKVVAHPDTRERQIATRALSRINSTAEEKEDAIENRKDEAWEDLGNTLRDMSNEEPGW